MAHDARLPERRRTPRTIQAVPLPSVDDERRPSTAVATIVVGAFVTVIAVLNGIVPPLVDTIIAVLP